MKHSVKLRIPRTWSRSGKTKLGEGNKTIEILIINNHLLLAVMQNLSLDMMKVPLRQFMNGDELVSWVHIDFREEADDSASDIELILVMDGGIGVGWGTGEEKEHNNYDDCVNKYRLHPSLLECKKGNRYQGVTWGCVQTLFIDLSTLWQHDVFYLWRLEVHISFSIQKKQTHSQQIWNSLANSINKT